MVNNWEAITNAYQKTAESPEAAFATVETAEELQRALEQAVPIHVEGKDYNTAAEVYADCEDCLVGSALLPSVPNIPGLRESVVDIFGTNLLKTAKTFAEASQLLMVIKNLEHDTLPGFFDYQAAQESIKNCEQSIQWLSVGEGISVEQMVSQMVASESDVFNFKTVLYRLANQAIANRAE